MPKHYDILVLGDYNLDLIFTGLPRFPEMGKDTVGTGFDMLPGEAYTPAVAMHRLGLKVGWASDFGNDEFSLFALKCARAEGLDDSLFVHHKRPYRRISVAASFPEDRAFITYYDPEPTLPAALKALTTASARVVFLPGLYTGPLLDTGVKVMRLKRMKLVMDGNSDKGTIDDPSVAKAIRHTDMFLPNAREARRLTGETDLEAAARRLAALGPLVVIKDGANGSLACQGKTIVRAPGIPLTPLDTTGAGDCYNTGFIKAWLDDLPLADCLRWGNIVGGLSTLARGGAGEKVTVEKVRQHWQDGI